MPLEYEKGRSGPWDPFAIMWVDPGTTSGVARGTFVPVGGGGIEEHFAFGLWETWEVTGTPGEQAWEIMGEFRDWRDDLALRYAYAPSRIMLGMESFQLRLNKARGAGSSEHMLDPIRVIHACEALSYCDGGERKWTEIELQTPSQKSTITNERLRRWGLWTKGSEHRRDATRHLAIRLSSFIDGKEVPML